MPVILQQQFPLGRFHATRWKQNPFEDRHGEWPPSPWRLLRALAARWVQYSRETGDEELAARDELLERLASAVPVFALPAASWRAEPAIRQYHKIGVEWTAKGKKDAAYRKPMTTLAIDSFRAVPFNEPVYWVWPALELPLPLVELLDQLLRRMLYFGRAESLCRIRRIEHLPPGTEADCRLSAKPSEHAPVMVPAPGEPLSLVSLMASTDDKVIQGSPVPPGAMWHYAELPKQPLVQAVPCAAYGFPPTLQVVQFAVGGRVYPHLREWVRVTGRFRGTALRELARLLTGDRRASFAALPPDIRDRFSLFSGKSGWGEPLSNHRHIYFALYPDDLGQPTRLVCFRREPFQPEEVAALIAASKYPCSWRYPGDYASGQHPDDWQLRFVPLPFEVPPPPGFIHDKPVCSKWISATPFVLPGGRHRFRKNGRIRTGETPERLVEKLLSCAGYPTMTLEFLTEGSQAEWLAIHESKEQRSRRREIRTRAALPGYRFRLAFSSAVSGPICVGHSCHYGLGLFTPVRNL